MTASRWRSFENEVRDCLQEKFKCKLPKDKILIKGKEKSFDLVNKEFKIVGDIKHYRNTKSGSDPSAKRSILNEYVWLLQMLPSKWKKIIVVGEDYDMATKYVKDFSCWLNDVAFYYYHRKSGLKLLKQGYV